MMKNIFFLFIALGLVLITSCSKDPVEILYGTWNLVSVEAESTITGEMSTASAAGSITFNEDGTGSLDYNFTVLGASSSTSGMFEYTADENTIQLNPGQPDGLTFTRIENKKNQQILEFEQDYTIDILKIRLTFEM